MPITKTTSAGLAGLIMVAVSSVPAAAEENRTDIPYCSQNMGVLAIHESEDKWWNRYNLGNPEAVIKLIVQRSGCFQLVDRGRGIDMRGLERDLADSGEMQPGSSMGGGQLLAADYFMIPDIVHEDQNTGGNNVGAAIGGFLGGHKWGRLAGGIQTQSMEAQTLLTLTNARTGVQELIAEGFAEKTDISFDIGAGLWGGSSAFSGLGGGYADTDIGRIITQSFVDAYWDLVAHVQSLAPVAAAAAPPPTVDVTGNPADYQTASGGPAYSLFESTRMYEQPDETSGTVRMLRQGTVVYPTGERSDIFWQVEDNGGNVGWVSSEFLDPVTQ
ncbi:MAG: SH3 domain-containing protein [Alphaproteobacteria bacterium]